MSLHQRFLSSAKGYFRFDRVAGSIDALDGLRAIAILLVLSRHAVFPTANVTEGAVWGFAGYDLATPFINGWIGVDLFFILSGFLIASHLLRKDLDAFRWRDYLAQRALRIIPTYWFVLLIVVAGAIPYYQFGSQFVFVRTAYHLLFLQDYLPPNIIVAFWSVGVEEKFYLLAPFLVFGTAHVRHVGTRITFLIVVALLAVLSRSVLALQNPGPTSYAEFVAAYRFPFHHCIDALVIGVITAVLYRKLKAAGKVHRKLGNLLAWGGLGLVGSFLCAGELLGDLDWWDKTLQPTVIALVFSAVVLGCALDGGPRRMLSCAALRITARLSYPLYLIHMALIPLCWHLIGTTPGNSGALLAFIPVFFAASFLAAIAIHFVVEKPFLIAKDKLREPARISIAGQRAAA